MTDQRKILVVDDEASCRNLLKDYLGGQGFTVDTAEGVAAAMPLLKHAEYDIVILDKNMPDEAEEGSLDGGMLLLRYIAQNLPCTQVIMVTGYATIETVVNAMKYGAFDYLAKPYNLSDLKKIVDRIITYRSFINPDRVINAYRGFHDVIVNALNRSNRAQMQEGFEQELIRSVNDQLDRIMEENKRLEHIIIEQRDSLANIAMYVSMLQEQVDSSRKEEIGELLQKIYSLSEQRL